MLARSLHEFGDLGGIIFNATTGNLIGGHQRVALFRADPEAEIVLTDEPNGRGYIETHGERFAFRQVQWDLQREKLAMVAANKQGGQWDTDALVDLIRDLDDKALMGFTDEEIAKLFPTPPPLISDPEPPDPGDENHAIRHVCPQCGHEWSGKPAPTP